MLAWLSTAASAEAPGPVEAKSPSRRGSLSRQQRSAHDENAAGSQGNFFALLREERAHGRREKTAALRRTEEMAAREAQAQQARVDALKGKMAEQQQKLEEEQAAARRREISEGKKKEQALSVAHERERQLLKSERAAEVCAQSQCHRASLTPLTPLAASHLSYNHLASHFSHL